MKVTVGTELDWSKIATIGGPVVDPMIVRSGELFLRGSTSARDPVGVWNLLTQNLHALGTFFDRLILDEKIPVFNYADTFDLDQNFDTRTLSRVNEQGEILVDVDVQYGVYQQVKDAAMAELRKLYAGGTRGVDAQEAYNILGELTTSGYAWYPGMGDLSLPNESERRLAAYLLGGLIFSSYAQLAGADHLMQPKRSRLFLAISLQKDTSRKAEEALFSKLGELLGRPAADLPYVPTFFPLLLQQSNGPAEVLKNALALRNSGQVRDYRAWLREALHDFTTNGRISIERAREVETIKEHILQQVKGRPFPEMEIKMTVADALALKPPEASVNLTEPVKAAWGWVIEQLPKKRHRKLLTRAILADREYVALDRRVQTVWSAAGI